MKEKALSQAEDLETPVWQHALIEQQRRRGLNALHLNDARCACLVLIVSPTFTLSVTTALR